MKKNSIALLLALYPALANSMEAPFITSQKFIGETVSQEVQERALELIERINEMKRVKMKGSLEEGTRRALEKELEILDLIRNSSKDVVNFSSETEYGNISSPLLTAISVNNVPIVDALLKQGADPNIGETLFEAACIITRHEDLIPTLVSHGANVKYRGKTYNRTVLHFAVRSKDIEAVVKAGGDVNAKDIHGETPLVTALKKRWYGLDPIKALLENGANANAKDIHGETVLMTALKKGCSLEIIEELLRYSADIHAKDSYDHTVLHYVQNAEVISLLVARGVGINAQNKADRTPLMSECYEQVNKINRILSLGDVKNLINPPGQTKYFVLALEKLARYQEDSSTTKWKDVCAAFYRDNKKIKKLVALGADATIKDNLGINAVDLGLNCEDLLEVMRVEESNPTHNAI